MKLRRNLLHIFRPFPKERLVSSLNWALYECNPGYSCQYIPTGHTLPHLTGAGLASITFSTLKIIWFEDISPQRGQWGSWRRGLTFKISYSQSPLQFILLIPQLATVTSDILTQLFKINAIIVQKPSVFHLTVFLF